MRKLFAGPISPWVLAAIVLPANACATWQPSVGPFAAFDGEEAPSTIRITTVVGNQVVLEQPTFRNDSVRGLGEKEARCLVSLGDCVSVRPPVYFDVTDVTVVEVRRISKRRTILTLGIASLAAKLIYDVATDDAAPVHRSTGPTVGICFSIIC